MEISDGDLFFRGGGFFLSDRSRRIQIPVLFGFRIIRLDREYKECKNFTVIFRVNLSPVYILRLLIPGTKNHFYFLNIFSIRPGLYRDWWNFISSYIKLFQWCIRNSKSPIIVCESNMILCNMKLFKFSRLMHCFRVIQNNGFSIRAIPKLNAI